MRKNNVLVTYSNLTKHLYSSTEVIPKIKEFFYLGKTVLTDGGSKLIIENVTIW